MALAGFWLLSKDKDGKFTIVEPTDKQQADLVARGSVKAARELALAWKYAGVKCKAATSMGETGDVPDFFFVG